MSDLQKDAARWRSKVTELIKVIYQVKDGALRSLFGEDARWHEKLSHVTAERGLLAAWWLAWARRSNTTTIERVRSGAASEQVELRRSVEMETPGHRPGFTYTNRI